MPNKKNVAKKVKKQDGIAILAHEGTKEALIKLEDILITEKDSKKYFDAELARSECQMLYYEPIDEQERKDFYLAKMIFDKEERMSEYEMELDPLFVRVDFVMLELVVRSAMLNNVIKKEEKEISKINRDVARDILSMDKDRLGEIRKNICDLEAWVAVAKKMIKTEKYKNIPADFFQGYHFDSEIDDCYCDDEDCCGCCSGCGEELKDDDLENIKF